MPEDINLEDILSHNPAIDPEKLRQSMELQERLRSCGVVGKGYELVPLFSGKQVRVVDTLSEEQDLTDLNRS